MIHAQVTQFHELRHLRPAGLADSPKKGGRPLRTSRAPVARGVFVPPLEKGWAPYKKGAFLRKPPHFLRRGGKKNPLAQGGSSPCRSVPDGASLTSPAQTKPPANQITNSTQGLENKTFVPPPFILSPTGKEKTHSTHRTQDSDIQSVPANKSSLPNCDRVAFL